MKRLSSFAERKREQEPNANPDPSSCSFPSLYSTIIFNRLNLPVSRTLQDGSDDNTENRGVRFTVYNACIRRVRMR